MFLAFFIVLFIPFLGVVWIVTNMYARIQPGARLPSPIKWTVAILLPIMFALYGLRRKSLNQSGAAASLIVGFLMTISSYRFMMAMLAFFICGSKATKFRAAAKKKFEADFKEGGQRNWIQVICNGGPATLLAFLYLLEVGSAEIPIDFSATYTASWYAIAVLAALACASGDTFASELGSVLASHDPLHIIQWTRVPRGTNGGVSLAGTVSSLLGGFIVGLAFYITLLLSTQWVALVEAPPQWPVIFYATVAGGLGSLIDSILGGTLQYSGRHKKLGIIVENKGPDIEDISGWEVLDNHSVNFLASLITGLIVPFIAAQSWSIFS